MATTRAVLNVFLASPIDLLLERTIAMEVVIGLNKLVGRQFGLHIDLRMWEDIGPGYGDPQSRINPDVDTCDLFIGLLWEKWGNPTAKYSSGFEEEFERAISRRRVTGRPEVWLVFKTPRPEKLDEPGPQLARVLEFRESVKASREVHYAEVKSSDIWRSELQTWLLGHVLRSAAVVQPEPTATPPTPSASGTDSSPDASEANAGIPAQLLELSASFRDVVKSGRLEFNRDEADLLGEFDVARLLLLSATWMARRYASDFLGTHHVNLLYKHRNELEATSAESFQLFRTLLRDSFDLIPGWFWFHSEFGDDVGDVLFFIAARDSDAGLRIRALQLLTSAGVQLPVGAVLPLLEDKVVSADAFKYLGRVGDERVLRVIDEVASTEESSLDSLTEARIRILVRTDPRHAFSELVSRKAHLSAELIQDLSRIVATLSREDLLQGSNSDDGDIRRLSVGELSRRSDLPLELAEALREDPAADVRQLALQKIVNTGGAAEIRKLRDSERDSGRDSTPSLLSLSGRPRLDLDLLTVNYYRTLPTEKLLDTISWSSVDGEPAYRVLAMERFESISNVIRSDLENGFERLKNRWLEDLKSRIGVEYAEKAEREWEEEGLSAFIRSQFTKAALSGLAIHGDASYINVARKHLSDENADTLLAAVTIVSKFGGSEDVEVLLRVSDRAWGGAKGLAAAAAIRLSPDPEPLALENVRAGDTERSKAGFDWLVDHDTPRIRSYFSELLADENDGSRLRAVYYLSRRLSRPELEKLLADYLDETTYYYNVVTWLDRLLYAPEPLREFFIHELERQTRS